MAPLELDELYEGTRLVVLGGTGFLGKIFWVLLLDRFPSLEKIFLMVRSSKEKTSEARLTEILESEAFRPLKDKYGEGFAAFVREKVVPFDGDMSRACCGMDGGLIAELHGTVDAVVNVAGVVDFNPPLDESIEANAFGARNLIALARALGDAPIFHTSTTMVAGDRFGVIVEEDPMVHPFPRTDELGRDIWDPEREIDECLELCAQAAHRSEDAFRQSGFAEQAGKTLRARGEPSEGPAFAVELAKVKRKFMKEQLVAAGLDRAKHWGWPNIYTYTKSIGEQIIARSGLPFTIGRPASCESTQRFPFEGWNEGIGTSAPFIFLAMKGHVQIPAGDVLLEFIPGDLVCIGMALSLAELLEGSQKPVYQYAVGEVNPCTAARFAELVGLYKRRSYQRRSTGNPIVNFLQAHVEPVSVTTARLEHVGPKAFARVGRKIAATLRAVEPLRPAAVALDAFAAREQKIGDLLDLFAPFTTVQRGPFSCANTRAAFARLSARDKERLPWDPEKLDWPHYWMTAHMPAVERRVIPEIEKRMKRELVPLAPHETLITLLDQMARRHDVALALQHLEDAGLTRVTYADLALSAKASAARLSLAGVAKGDRVVLSAHNHPDWAIAYFGILRAGATAVPVDPGISPDAFVRVLAESHARVVVGDAKVKERLAAHVGSTWFDLHDLTEKDPALEGPLVDVDPGDIASLIYTSGTTGTPKGVMLTHANFTSLIAALAPLFPLRHGDRVLSVLPLHHTFEFTCGLLLPLSRGARVVYVGDVTSDRLTRGLELGRVTAMVGVPALWQLLERRILSQVKAKGPIAETAFNVGTELNRRIGDKLGIDAGRLLFGSVHGALGGKIRYLISGGAALPRDTQKLFQGLGLPLIEGYGLTEAAPVLTVSRGVHGEPQAGYVGKAVPGVELRIDDPNDQGIGEVLARGPNVMAGYTDPEATAATIDAEGWLHTGDLGKLDRQGRLSIAGRLKDVIVTSTGENVYPDDLEREIGAVAHITELTVVGLGSGSGEKVACLAVPADVPGAKTDRAARNERAMQSLRAALGKLPYGKQPAVVHLYDAPLPRTPTRKVKRAEVKEILARMALATAPVSGDGQTSAVRVAIGAIRGRAPADLAGALTLQDDLGFDSLALSELLVALEAKFGAIEPVALQACRTVADVEALVGAGREPPADQKRAAIRDDEGERIVLPPVVQEAGKRIIGKLQDAFYGKLMNPRVYGRAFIPHNRNTIVVANHSSHLDMGFVRHALGSYGEDIVSLAAQDYFFDKRPIQRAFFENLTNLQALDRRSGLRASERQAAEILSQGKTMLIFPEGTRSADGDIHDFKPLLGHLALTYAVDILPVFLDGTREAMPKGQRVPTRRDIVARIGPPLGVDDMRRLTRGMTPADAAREISRLAQQAVLALRAGDILDLTALGQDEDGATEPMTPPEDRGLPASSQRGLHRREHPLVTLFAELESKFKPGVVPKPLSFYFTLGGDPLAKWTVKVDASSCEIHPGKPEGTDADCVLKTSPEIFTKIVREAYTPGLAEFLSGAVKSNDVELLLTFQRAFELG
jgi:long-chain acyl-CoA synthetase